MTRLSMRVNRTTKACSDAALDMSVLANRAVMCHLSDDQVKNLAQKCYITQKDLRGAEKAFDREFNRRIKARLAEAKGT